MLTIDVFPDHLGEGVNGFMLRNTLEDMHRKLREKPSSPEAEAFAEDLDVMCEIAQRLWNDLQKVAAGADEFEKKLVAGICKIINEGELRGDDIGAMVKKLPDTPEPVKDLRAEHAPRNAIEEIWAKV